MPTYTGSVTTPAAVNGAAYAVIRNGSLRRVFIREIGFFTQAPTASSVGLGIPGNAPVATTSLTGIPQDVNDATCLSFIDTVWSTIPTVPAAFMKKATLGASIGAGVIWTFPTPLIMPKSTYLVLWNHGAAAGSALDLEVVFDE